MAGAVPQPHCHTRADPSGGGFAFTAVKATPVETCHRHVSKSRLSNPPPAFRQSKKDIPFGMSFRFGGRWWIRTTEVIDDRFTVCSLWPLGKPSIFNYQLDWSWWTDLNPRPADYKSAALPTELHQHSCAATIIIIAQLRGTVKRFFEVFLFQSFRIRNLSF